MERGGAIEHPENADTQYATDATPPKNRAFSARVSGISRGRAHKYAVGIAVVNFNSSIDIMELT